MDMNIVAETLSGSLTAAGLQERIKFYEEGGFAVITLCALAANTEPLNYAVFRHTGVPPQSNVRLVEAAEDAKAQAGKPPFPLQDHGKTVLSCAPTFLEGKLKLVAALRE